MGRLRFSSGGAAQGCDSVDFPICHPKFHLYPPGDKPLQVRSRLPANMNGAPSLEYLPQDKLLPSHIVSLLMQPDVLHANERRITSIFSPDALQELAAW